MADTERNVLNVLGVGASTQEEPTQPVAEKQQKKQKQDPVKKKPAQKKATARTKSLEDLIFPEKKETKSRRLQVLMKPSTYEKLKETAEANGTNVNELINVILENFLR